MNKKIIINTLTILFVIIIVACNVNALGIAPSKKIMPYDTEEHIYTIKIVNTEAKDMTLKISAEGILAYAVTIDNSIIRMRSDESEKDITYRVKLPQDLTPGSKVIFINIAETNEGTNPNAISGLLTLSHQLIINVPYTGLYAEGFLSISSTINSEETIATITLANKGSEIISTVSGSLNVRDLNGNIMYTREIQEQHNLIPGSSIKIEELFDIGRSGIYNIEYDINYDNKNIILSKTFNIGEYNLIITGASVKNFRLGTIAKLEVDISNDWNVPIENAYGEIIVTDVNGAIVGTANTTKTTINPTTGKITVYWDTANIKTGQYTLNLKLYAGDKIITQSYPSTIDNDKFIIGTQQPKTEKTNYITIIVLIALAGIFVFILFKRRNKKVYK
jgi:LPXTG-motif cell wall-anchored protein